MEMVFQKGFSDCGFRVVDFMQSLHPRRRFCVIQILSMLFISIEGIYRSCAP